MTAFAQIIDRSTVRYERLLPGSAERLWGYLTESDKRAKWLASGDMELHAGGAMALEFRNDDLSSPPEKAPPEQCTHDGVHRLAGAVLRCEPHRLLVLRWGTTPDASEVSFELEPVGDQVRLILTHRRLSDAIRLNIVSGWHVHLDTLAQTLEGEMPQGFWSRWLTLRDDYSQRLGA